MAVPRSARRSTASLSCPLAAKQATRCQAEVGKDLTKAPWRCCAAASLDLIVPFLLCNYTLRLFSGVVHPLFYNLGCHSQSSPSDTPNEAHVASWCTGRAGRR